MTLRLILSMRKHISALINNRGGVNAYNYCDVSNIGIANQSRTTNIKEQFNLPLRATLKEGFKVVVTVMTDEQFSITYDLIQEASRKGNGYAIDEFETMDDFRECFKLGYNFAVTMETSGEYIASFLFSPSRYGRGIKVMDPYSIVKPEYRAKGVGQFCLGLTEQFCKRLGFIGIYVDCFSNSQVSKDMLDKREGYELVGKLPASGLMPDGTVAASLIYFKDFRKSNVCKDSET